MALDTPFLKEKFVEGSFWNIMINVNGYLNNFGEELSTQIASGRSFEFLERYQSKNLAESTMIKVRLLEDGYICWVFESSLNGNIYKKETWEPFLLDRHQIQSKIPLILKWVEDSSTKINQYLWGGTLGPNFDCSGLIQSAFSRQNIWLPRDSYQQEKFCKKVTDRLNYSSSLIPGDLVFFGIDKCDHVGIYKGNGFYWHSSGKKFGNNGIYLNNLKEVDKSPIASHYRSRFRSAGRVVRCHDGTTLK